MVQVHLLALGGMALLWLVGFVFLFTTLVLVFCAGGPECFFCEGWWGLLLCLVDTVVGLFESSFASPAKKLSANWPVSSSESLPVICCATSSFCASSSSWSLREMHPSHCWGAVSPLPHPLEAPCTFSCAC